jgi:dephospho-CoA kinase
MKRSTSIFALTGNIGMGKSTVAWIFEELGVPLLYADEIAHEALAPHSHAWKAVYERYGRKVIGTDDLVDRTTLAEIVFNDPAERRWLESVIHPFVKQEIGRRAATYAKDETPCVIAEVPLLFEAHWEKDFDAVIVVRASREQEIQRSLEKFGLAHEEIEKRIAAQFPIERKIAGAHAVIDNDGGLDETRVQVTRLHQEMVKGTFPGERG